ncbi:MAG: serine/threonine protein kinase, partial [Planctomycetota bacterium]
MAERSIFDLDPDQLDRLLSIGNDTIEKQNTKGQETPADQAHVRPGGNQDLSGPERSGNSTASYATVVEQPGGWIGQYKLLSVLGEGGMGIVYLAEQERPIKRRVALKVIKPGMDSKRVIARFEAERQALALLDHPNIAHVHDAGTTQTGRPYFVMEYVKGLSITDYCDHHKLTIEDRLTLFMLICQAVQHAHQKGIIHRDIKPSNILVSMENDRAMPKIIDLGVAKAISQPLTERTLVTEQGQLFGTPEYMSPEQADMANEDIDTRSDVYSLGVLLYVLLTGVLPFDSEILREGGVEHIRRTIRETDPKTPSTRLSSLGEEAKKIAEGRRTEVVAL